SWRASTTRPWWRPSSRVEAPTSTAASTSRYAATSEEASAAAGVVAARRARVTAARALHHAAALVAGGPQGSPRPLRRPPGGRLGQRLRRGNGLAVAVSAAVPSVGGSCRVGRDPEPELARLRILLGTDLLGQDPELLELVGVLDEAARQPAHDVVGH